MWTRTRQEVGLEKLSEPHPPAYFWEWVVGTTLAPLPYLGWNMRFSREAVDDLQQGGLSVCPDCEQRWEQSGIIPSLLRVDWSALKSEDPHLKLMLDEYKLANKLRLSDGLGKVFCIRMADVVFLHGLCSRHSDIFL